MHSNDTIPTPKLSARKKTRLFTCETCGIIFATNQKHVDDVERNGGRVRYCSRDCLYHRDSKVSFQCEWCDRPFTRFPSEVEKAKARGSSMRFCSKKCDHASKSATNETHTCEVCGDVFTVWASKIKHSIENGWAGARFCSRACAERSGYRRKPQRFNAQCLWCGKDIQIKTHELGKANYCDQPCSMKHRRAKAIAKHQKPCSVCGKMLEIQSGEPVPNYAKRLTCSGECRAEQIRRTRFGEEGPARLYPPEFNADLKRQIRERDGFACQECGVLEDGRAHDVHHIDYDKENSDPINLITLCLYCHRRTTNPGDVEYWVVRYQGMMRERTVQAA